MKKNKISKNWLIKQKKDIFFNQSKAQGYRSRSAFKLLEMNKKFKLLNKSSLVLDLGSSPGGWSQVASKEITLGKILAVDIKPMEKINNTFAGLSDHDARDFALQITLLGSNLRPIFRELSMSCDYAESNPETSASAKKVGVNE